MWAVCVALAHSGVDPHVNPTIKKKQTLNYHITSGVEVVFLKSVGSDGFLDEASAA